MSWASEVTSRVLSVPSAPCTRTQAPSLWARAVSGGQPFPAWGGGTRNQMGPFLGSTCLLRHGCVPRA